MVRHTQSTESPTDFGHTILKYLPISSQFQCLISLVHIPLPLPFSLDEKARKKWSLNDRNMSCFKLKVVVHFLRIVIYLLLSRRFGERNWNHSRTVAYSVYYNAFQVLLGPVYITKFQNASNVFRPHYAGKIWKCNNHRSVWICVWVKLGKENIMITSSLQCRRLIGAS